MLINTCIKFSLVDEHWPEREEDKNQRPRSWSKCLLIFLRSVHSTQPITPSYLRAASQLAHPQAVKGVWPRGGIPNSVFAPARSRSLGMVMT
jgi:hypothetical protein